MLKCNKIASLFILTPIWLFANTAILSEIKNSLEDIQSPKNYRGYTNILSDVSETSSPNIDMSLYWTGNVLYEDSFSRIHLVQLIHDTLLAFPHKGDDFYTQPTYDEIKEVISVASEAYYYMANRDIDHETLSLATKHTLTIFGYKNFQAYVNLSSLMQKVSSCNAYWDGGSDMFPKAHSTIHAKSNFNEEIPERAAYCQKIMCNTSSTRPYNGFFEISQKAAHTKELLEDINCSSAQITQGTHAAAKISVCKILSDHIKKDTYLHAVKIPMGADLPAHKGKSYIEDLQHSSPYILKALKVLITLQIDEQSYTKRFNSPAFSSIYTPPSGANKYCKSSSISNTIIQNNHRCDPQVIDAPDGNMDVYVRELLGLGELDSVIEAGLPLGLKTTSGHVLLQAGMYNSFTAVPTRENSHTLWRAISPTEKVAPFGYGIYIHESDIKQSQDERNAIMTTFYMNRAKKQNAQISKLFQHSASLETINDVRAQNKKIMSFEDNANQFRTTQLKLLQESAAWRLLPSNQNWINQVSSISNIALLREMVILLSEIKHIQFLKYSNLQKTILLEALDSISNTHNLGGDAITRLIHGDAKKFYAGGASSTPGMPGGLDISNPGDSMPPNDEKAAQELESQKNQAKDTAQSWM
jgi:hypothetical protein